MAKCKHTKSFPCLDSSSNANFAFCDVYLYALSSFLVQMGHMFISCHFYFTSKVSCEYHLTSIKTFYITHHDNAHNNQLHWVGSHITSNTPCCNSRRTCALTRPPPYLLDSSLVPCFVKFVQHTRHTDLSPFEFVHTFYFEVFDRAIEQL